MQVHSLPVLDGRDDPSRVVIPQEADYLLSQEVVPRTAVEVLLQELEGVEGAVLVLAEDVAQDEASPLDRCPLNGTGLCEFVQGQCLLAPVLALGDTSVVLQLTFLHSSLVQEDTLFVGVGRALRIPITE